MTETACSACVEIPLQMLDAGLEPPRQAYAGDAGVDLRSRIDAVLEPFQRLLIPTGIAIALPEGYAGFVVPRSGLAIRNGISIVNSPGLIDSNYRGEIGVVLINLDPKESFSISKGDRIAQLVVTEVAAADFMETASLDGSCRGAGGFGSSGVV